MNEGDELKIILDQLSSLQISSPSSVPYVCYVYDEEMMEHERVGDEYHPERPSRIQTIHQYLSDSGLIDKMQTLESRYALEEEIALAHDPEFVKKVLEFEKIEKFSVATNQDEIVEQKKILFPFDSDTYFCHSSARAAKLACGSVLSCVDKILDSSNSCDRGFACIRPPGHHATYSTSMGFCLFNNVAIAANYARKKFNLNRIAILDWDVHHGNGTNDIFTSDLNTLFMSIHRFDRGKFYPGSGNWTDIGSGKGLGFTINMPIDGSYGDEEMYYLFEKIVLPALNDFKPELLLVSAGFDAAENDPLGLCHVHTHTFGTLTKFLIEVCPKILLVLEGGYNLRSIGNACVSCCEALVETIVTPFRSPSLSAISSPSSTGSSSSTVSTISSIRSVPGGVPKTSTVQMINRLTELLADSGGVSIPVVPAMNPFVSRKDRKKQVGKKGLKTPPPSVEEPGAPMSEFLLVSGAGHAGAVLRYDASHVIKRTTIREALAYILIAEAIGDEVEIVCEDPSLTLSTIFEAEKKRIDFDANRESFAELSRFVNKCTQVMIHSSETASIIIEDMTSGFAVDDNLGVLDVKLGTVYHTPEDSAEKIASRLQKADRTSASELGIRVLACKCMDGFSVGKNKANKMKRMEQMVPLVRRFLYSDIEAFDAMISDMEMFVSKLRDSLSDKIKFNFISSSILFVIGRGPQNNVMLRCKLIDLAHLFPESTSSGTDMAGKLGLIKGCTSLLEMLSATKEPSYESA